MVFTSNEIDIFSRNEDQTNYLYFEFKGKFTEEASKKACAAWTKHLGQNMSQTVLIWDCLKMDGFEMAAKNEWVKALNQLHDKVSSVTVVSDNIVIRGASRLMFKLFGFKSKVVKSHKELKWSQCAVYID